MTYVTWLHLYIGYMGKDWNQCIMVDLRGLDWSWVEIWTVRDR
jgi:hypothetical protein